MKRIRYLAVLFLYKFAYIYFLYSLQKLIDLYLSFILRIEAFD